ncbi:MAG: hypothetical protein MSC31_18550 [Solirubrobacteraceae bacterium MAG38_C4-C5]|nr:hypothetical protein [Candidatus Siliceabacter maunaloa]
MNPFIYDRPLPPDQLVGREAELALLLDLALGGQSARVAAPRRYGKTTLLGALADTAWNSHEMIPALVDFSRVTSIDDVVERLERAYEHGFERGRLRTVWRSLRRRGGASAQLGVPGLATVTGAVTPRADAQSLARLHDVLDLPRQVHARTGQRCLVILDEFQDLLTAGDELDGVLRSHLQHHVGIASYVFAGSQPSLMRSLFGDRRRPLFEQARSVALGPLPAGELAEWIDARLAAAGSEAAREHVDELAAVTAGHPQRAMLVAHFLYQDGGDEGLAPALAAAVREAADALDQAWRSFTQVQRRVLGAVAAGHTRLLTDAALAYTRHGKSTQRQARRMLLAEGHLHEREDGTVAFSDPFFPLWLA